MSTDGMPRPQDWKDLYQLAMLETDPAKLPPLIADAHKAVLDRIQETLTPGGAKAMARDLSCGNRAELANWFPRRVQAKPPNCLIISITLPAS